MQRRVLIKLMNNDKKIQSDKFIYKKNKYLCKYSTLCPCCISQIVQSSVMLNQHNNKGHIGDVQRYIMIMIFVSVNYVIVGI